MHKKYHYVRSHKTLYSKYFEVGVHIRIPVKNSYQDDLGRTILTLDPIEREIINTHIITNRIYNVWHVN